MAYFAMFVSNSELAKSGGGSDLPQGLAYFWNFVSTYVLWVPLLLAVPIVYPRITRWWRSGDHTGTVVLLAPLLAGAADALYVVHVGGDYMEARLLLPALLCCCLAVFVDVKQFRTLVASRSSGWPSGRWCAFRGSARPMWCPSSTTCTTNGRSAIADSGERNPIDLNAYPRFVSLGRVLEETAGSIPSGHRSMVVLEDPGRVFIVPSTKPQSLAILEKHWKEFVGLNLSTAHSTLPFRLAINLSSIGEMGYEAGPNVYIFDALSLANPIGSHTTMAVRGVPGHEKVIGQAWMIARFGVPGEEIPNISIFGLAQETASARRALNCNPLRSYLGGHHQAPHVLPGPLEHRPFVHLYHDELRSGSPTMLSGSSAAAESPAARRIRAQRVTAARWCASVPGSISLAVASVPRAVGHHRPGVDRVDDGVDEPPLGGLVRGEEPLGVLGLELLPLLGLGPGGGGSGPPPRPPSRRSPPRARRSTGRCPCPWSP